MPSNLLHPAMRLIRRSLYREWLYKWCAAVVLLIAGMVWCYIFFRRGNILSVLGLLLLLTGLRLLREVLRSPVPQKSPLWQILTGNPMKIVWVYTVKTQVMPFGFLLWEAGQMYFKLNDGDEISITLPARKLIVVSRFLNHQLPHASFGYSPQKEALYRENPIQLFRTERH